MVIIDFFNPSEKGRVSKTKHFNKKCISESIWEYLIITDTKTAATAANWFKLAMLLSYVSVLFFPGFPITSLITLEHTIS